MADALTLPLLIAAAVLGVAGIAKLREPAGAARALAVLGIGVPQVAVRAFALGELGLAAWTLAEPSPASAGVLAGLYAIFAVTTLVLARRSASCGCFGEREAPASIGQSLLSASLSAVALAAAITGVHGVGWVFDRSVESALVLMVGSVGAAYGLVVAYSEIPLAWSVWSGR